MYFITVCVSDVEVLAALSVNGLFKKHKRSLVFTWIVYSYPGTTQQYIYTCVLFASLKWKAVAQE